MSDRFFEVLEQFYDRGIVLNDDGEYGLQLVLDRVPVNKDYLLVEKVTNLTRYDYMYAMKALRDLAELKEIDVEGIDERVVKVSKWRDSSGEHNLPKAIYNP